MPGEAQEEVRDEAGPDLSLDGVLAVADEVVYLAGLLEFLEEGLDLPAGLVEFRDGPRRPREVVREEDHPPHVPVDLDEGRDAAEATAVRRVLGGGRGGRGADLLVRQYLRRVPRLVGDAWLPKPLHHVEEQVRLLAHGEEHAAQGERAEELHVEVGAVGDEDVPLREANGAVRRPDGVVVRRLLDHGERGEAAGHVKQHVQLRGGLPPAVPRPVDAVQDQLYRRGVQGVLCFLIRAR